MDPDEFQVIIDEKGEKIEELNKIDEGFDTLFSYVEKEINENRMTYRTQIEQMQKLIGEVSELGIQIQALEHQNSGHLKVYLANQRKVVREFYVNSRTTSSYYQNMANAPKPEQSYFLIKPINFFENRVKFYLIAPIYIMSNRKDSRLITKAGGGFHCRARGPVGP